MTDFSTLTFFEGVAAILDAAALAQPERIRNETAGRFRAHVDAPKTDSVVFVVDLEPELRVRICTVEARSIADPPGLPLHPLFNRSRVG